MPRTSSSCPDCTEPAKIFKRKCDICILGHKAKDITVQSKHLTCVSALSISSGLSGSLATTRQSAVR